MRIIQHRESRGTKHSRIRSVIKFCNASQMFLNIEDGGGGTENRKTAKILTVIA